MDSTKLRLCSIIAFTIERNLPISGSVQLKSVLLKGQLYLETYIIYAFTLPNIYIYTYMYIYSICVYTYVYVYVCMCVYMYLFTVYFSIDILLS